MDLAHLLDAALGLDGVQELGGGHQSRVFRITVGGRTAVAKVLDASVVDRGQLDARLAVTAALANLDPRVCRPLELRQKRVTELSSAEGERYVVLFEFAAGASPDPGRATDAEQMGAMLAELHSSMRKLPPALLPLVSALRAVPADRIQRAGAHQLLHGDFSASNLRKCRRGMGVFDLDDCGYGPPAFDVANALYMVLFDAFARAATATYDAFRSPFLAGYCESSGSSLSDESLDRFIDLRVQALRSWLEDLDNAPIGIRTSSPTWQSTLRSFVDSYRPRTF